MAQEKKVFSTKLRVGDPVVVTQGGNAKKQKSVKGETGKILRILPKKERVIVEGVNMVKRHKRAMAQGEAAGIIEKEAAVHISNVMYYRDDVKKAVRIKFSTLDDGRKVRGFIHPETKKFEQIDV